MWISSSLGAKIQRVGKVIVSVNDMIRKRGISPNQKAPDCTAEGQSERDNANSSVPARGS